MAQVDYNKPLMPKATAVWLIDNTALSFEQIAEFCGLDALEVQAIADEEIGRGIVGRNPIENKELTKEEIERCQNDENARLIMMKSDLPKVKVRSKGPKYTPISKRGDKPNAIAYILKNHPEINDAKICKLIGTTKPTIQSIRDKTHADIANIKARHPAELGLCTYVELQEASEKGLEALGKDNPQAQTESIEENNNNNSDPLSSGFDFSNFMGSAAKSKDSAE